MTARLLPLLLLLLAAAPAGAQSVADYYHTAARAYIGGENAEAEAAAEAGLALDPTDARLRALLEKIREKNQEGSGGEQEQEDADQPDDGEGEPQDDAQRGEQEDETEQEGEPQDQQQEPQQGQQQPEEPSDQEPQGEQEGSAEGEQPADPQGGGGQLGEFEGEPGQMSRADAERILRAIESDELELLREVQQRRARPRYVEKDW